MAQVRKYHLAPTDLIPNSPRPLLHYKNVLATHPQRSGPDTHSPQWQTPQCAPAEVWALFTKKAWEVAWILRYGPTQSSHYHSQAHECMAVLSGTATIRFGVADTSEDLTENTTGSAWEDGGVELEATPGDVFVIPAGVAHKTYNAKPEAEFSLLTPGKGQGIEAENPEEALAGIELSGFTMLGAYAGGGAWDFVKSGGDFERVWSVPKPEHDPVFGKGDEGLCKTWPGSDRNPDVEVVKLD